MAVRQRFWVPHRRDESASDIQSNEHICNASGEYAAIIFSVPRSGTLTRFEFNMAAVGSAPANGVRCSFQDPDDTTGMPDGGVDQFATIASGSVTTGWLSPGDFDTTRAVTAGQVLCAVIDNPSFTSGDSFTVGHTIVSSDSALPYAISSLSGTPTKNVNEMPLVAIRYDDGTYENVGAEIYPAETATYFGDTQSDTSPDEIGLSFVVQRAYTLLAFCAHAVVAVGATAGTTWDAILYDAAGGVISTQTLDADATTSLGSGNLHQHYLPAPVVLRPGHRYRLAVKPNSSTVSFRVYYLGFASQALMDTFDADGWYACARTDGGSWTDYNNGSDGYRRPGICLFLETVTSAPARLRVG